MKYLKRKHKRNLISGVNNLEGQQVALKPANKLFKNYNYFIDRLADFDEDMATKFYNATANLDIVDLNLKIEKDLEAVQKIFDKLYEKNAKTFKTKSYRLQKML